MGKQKKLMLLGGLRYLLSVIEEAHKLGVYVITADYLPDNIAHKYSDEYCNVSIVDKEAVLEAAKRLQIDGIMSFAVDPGVVSAAYVAEKMGLPFQCSYEAACILQDKSRFRKFLSDNGFNCPKAKGYTSVEVAMKDIDYFNWPVIVKPVDSAGSKGVTKVSSPEQLPKAIERALRASISKCFIIEDYLELQGFQSSADVFTINGILVCPVFSDQIFDINAANPYTPAIEIWPSSMPETVQKDLVNELQRLFTLLSVRTGIYNVESRLCANGKAYIMEVSPRGGGNRIAELQEMATGQKFIKNEIAKALELPMCEISSPNYDGVWCNYIMHSTKQGILSSVIINDEFKERYIKSISFTKLKGDMVEAFSGAHQSLGTIFLRFESRKELDAALQQADSWFNIDIA